LPAAVVDLPVLLVVIDAVVVPVAVAVAVAAAFRAIRVNCDENTERVDEDNILLLLVYCMVRV